MISEPSLNMTENIREEIFEGLLTEEETIDVYHKSIVKNIEKLQTMKTGISPEKWREMSENISQLREVELKRYSGNRKIFKTMDNYDVAKRF